LFTNVPLLRGAKHLIYSFSPGKGSRIESEQGRQEPSISPYSVKGEGDNGNDPRILLNDDPQVLQPLIKFSFRAIQSSIQKPGYHLRSNGP